MTSLRIAQAQIPVYTDRIKLTETLKSLAEQAAEENAGLLALPEMFCCPYDVGCFSCFCRRGGRSSLERPALTLPAISGYISLPAPCPKETQTGRYTTQLMYLTGMAGRSPDTEKCTFSILM